MKLILNEKYKKVGDEKCYNLISSSIHTLDECKFIKNINNFNSVIQKYAANDLVPIFESKYEIQKNIIEKWSFIPLYIGPLSKDFCNKYQLAYRHIIDDNIEHKEMEIRFNPDFLNLIPDQLKPFLIGMVEVDKNSLYKINDSELIGIQLGGIKDYVPKYCYGKKLMLWKNISIWSEAEEILYFEKDLPDIQIDENEISNSAYSYFIASI